MTTPQQLAKQLRDVYFGGNWTAVNLKDTLADIHWQQAVTKVYNLNTIAALVFHINYYVDGVIKVLQGEPLKSNDKFSFDLQPIPSEDDWQKLVTRVFSQAELFAGQIENLDEQKLFEVFQDEKYGNYFRNLSGIIEHAHYHLGQIVLISKILNEPKSSPGLPK